MARPALSALALALFGVLAAPASAQRVDTVFADQDLPVRSGRPTTVVITCRPGYVATGGSTQPLPPDVTLLKSAGTGASRIFRFETAGYGPTTVTLVVTCLKKVVMRFVPGVGRVPLGIRLRKVRSPVIRVLPGSTQKPKLRCPGGMAPVGHGFEVTPAPGGGSVRLAQAPSRQPRLIPFEKVPLRGGFNFGVQHVDGPPADLRVVATCASRSQSGRHRGGRVRRPFPIVRRTVDTDVPPGASRLEQRCRRGFAPVEVGFDIPDGSSTRRRGSHSSGRRGAIWRFVNGGATADRVTVYLLCAQGRQFALRLY